MTISGVVFKQSYQSKNLKSATPVLNVKHLIYIATRPGAVHNPQCGFGLWGRLPGISVSENINSLKTAQKIVKEASKNHTLWRAILSVDDLTAKQHGLYQRETWQTLVNTKIKVIADEMGISDRNFCWMASMHYAKGHPHVHILYWDSSDTIHREAMSKERFGILAERVRAAFDREIYREELREAQGQQAEERSQLRLELKAMLAEANLAEALDLNHIKAGDLTALQQAFSQLVGAVSPKGRMTYAFQQKAVDIFLDKVMEISDFRKQLTQYEKLTQEISTLYGNGQEKQDFELERARKKLYNALGNEVLSTVQQYRQQLSDAAPHTREAFYNRIQETSSVLLPTMDSYHTLLAAMPKERTPRWVLMQDKEWKDLAATVVRELAGDMRISALLYGYVQSSTSPIERDEAVQFRKETYRQLYQQLYDNVWKQAEQDAGYPVQAQTDAVIDLLIRLLGSSSQQTGQAQARRDLLLGRKELSKTAQRDRQQERQHGGSWSPDL